MKYSLDGEVDDTYHHDRNTHKPEKPSTFLVVLFRYFDSPS